MQSKKSTSAEFFAPCVMIRFSSRTDEVDSLAGCFHQHRIVEMA